MTIPLLLLLLSAQESAPRPSLLAVDLSRTRVDATELVRRGFDVVHVDPEAAVVDLIGDGEDRARLETLGLPYEVVHADLRAFYASRLTSEAPASPPSLGAWLTPPFAQGAIGGYYSFTEVESVLDQITAAYPSLTTDKFSIGQTLQGREIWAVKVSDNPDTDEAEPEVRFDAMHHAREPMSMQTTLWVMLCLLENYGTDPLATYLVNEREIWFLPCVNPDGYVYNQQTDPGGGGLWRKNRRNNGDGTFGVDLNRNYDFQWGFDDFGSSPDSGDTTYRGPSPASEPETQVMQAFLAARDFKTAFSTHSFSDVLIHPLGYIDAYPANIAAYTEISTLTTEISGYPFGNVQDTLGYIANGGTFDYDQGVHGTLCWTPEIGSDTDQFWPATNRIVPLAQQNELSFLRTAWAAGTYVRATSFAVTESGDGDGFFEPGETVEYVFAVRNSGLGTAAVDLVLDVTHPDAIVTQGLVGLGSVASFTDADNAGLPLAFAIDAGAASGTAIPYSASIQYEGYVEELTGTIVVGQPRLLVADDVEVDVGWLTGLPGDTATTGLWEYGDPIGTFSDGEPSNPDADASAAPGVNCFVTGNGRGSVGNDDVDDGFTTLVTPALDLSGSTQAVVSYRRWYANLGSPQDDVFEVSISDDDGMTWVPLETVTTTENVWTEKSFVVSDFVALTETVRLRFVATDDPNNSLTEAGVDELYVSVFDPPPRLNFYGKPEIGTPLATHVAGDPGVPYRIYASAGTASVQIPGVVGPLLLDSGSLFKLTKGAIPLDGFERFVSTLPNDASMIGSTFYLQALTIGTTLRLSNRTQLTFE